MLGEKRPRKKFVVFLLVEPGAFDVEEFQAGHSDGERERIDRELRDWLVRARIRFVVEDVHGVVSDLQKVDVARDAARRPTRRELDAVSGLDFADFVSVSQMGISIATVLESFASMKFCSVSCRSLLLPTAGMISAAVSVAVFSLRLMMRRLLSANAGCACEARAFGSSSLRKSSCGQVEGMFSRKVASASKR